ncbi:hypothetical protein S7335_1428 [Synechococcus sp. PCC 7335]|uniref:DsbA family protein n=1 Tax=Synechococcus sp. (strain ATCC 29403 / PCC 7335) TaxID=91464 RepID=UPI00017EDD01|nr:thioredoxin domain-containing protein [Synechococcus sp. PCC 7335]EDX83731.1 hypothetical protein S7335_1428 [Synechococcus sp. PCC 7335]
MDAMPILKETDHTRGSLSAALLMMTYGTYQCPYSEQAHKTTQKLCQSLGDQFCFVFRHFPQPDIYPQSRKAAETAEAAGSQGKFWEMHDKLFDNTDKLDDASLVEYADELGLDVPQFLHELGYHLHASRIQSDIDSAKQYGVKKSPTFFISVRHQGTEKLETLVQQILTVALKNAG